MAFSPVLGFSSGYFFMDLITLHIYTNNREGVVYMGSKLLWTGLTLIIALSELVSGLPLVLVGAIIMVIGLVLLWLDK